MLKRRVLCALFIILVASGCGGAEQNQLNVFAWANYVSDDIRSAFEREFGARVVVDTFASNEDLLTKLQSGASGYDIVMPSDFMVGVMIEGDLLTELNRDNIPNFRNISPQFLGKYFDPGNLYSVPYTWGTAGIAYDSSKVKPPPDSWTVLWDTRYSGSFSMLDDQREVIGAALKLLGYSVNTTSLEELAAAKQILLEQKPLVKLYRSEADEILSSGDVDIAHCWSGDAFRAAENRPDLRYFIPKEGSTQFIDTVCIPAGAPHKELAEQFIDYLLRPEVNAKITNFTKYGTCVSAAKEYVSEKLRDEPGIYPSEEVLSRMESLIDVKEFTVQYNRAWEEIKAQ
ncbi:MAG: spermidine/putrescine ABC transporter substrate-binding protein [Candidatus Poribacteria bacterium]|nr:spermidine/putrescine ABC transporter substrate-binding protein [Candidatus Poribacteria bacterium]MDE0504381.1 spermidine/putrescine ABC transporter substrate-binding protein [Candidatus Poribacteria bacterium]